VSRVRLNVFVCMRRLRDSLRVRLNVCVCARSACVFVCVRACLCMREAECVRVRVLVRMQPTIKGVRQVLRGY
jgi:hypothetical protein